MDSVVTPRSIWIGWDPREVEAYDVAEHSIKSRLSQPIPIHSLKLGDLRRTGLYTRPTEKRGGKLYDSISDAPMSTEFAISRFLVPHMAQRGWALFMDCDMLVLTDLVPLFKQAEEYSEYAVLCVHHEHKPTTTEKMDGQAQLLYARKNWSSVVMFNCDHPSNQELLKPSVVNTVTGRALHRFFWLRDEEIGTLGPEWNVLAGYTKLPEGREPRIIHYTEGGPWFKQYQDVEYAQLWLDERKRISN